MGLLDDFRLKQNQRQKIPEREADINLSEEGLRSLLVPTSPRSVLIELQDKKIGGEILKCQYCHGSEGDLLLRVFYQGKRVVSIEVVLSEEDAIQEDTTSTQAKG